MTSSKRESEEAKKRRMRTLELLAPAKNLECGIAAIDHGADAVYIGAPKFGARAAAGNSIEDIRQLCDYAHQFHAKVHVTVNTIVYDSEIRDTLQMIQQLQAAGVDALLLQDMGVLYALSGRGPFVDRGRVDRVTAFQHPVRHQDCRQGEVASVVGLSSGSIGSRALGQ